MNTKRAKLVGVGLLVIGLVFYLQGQSLTVSAPSADVPDMVRMWGEARQYNTYATFTIGLGGLILLAVYLVGGKNNSSGVQAPSVRTSVQNTSTSNTNAIFHGSDGKCEIVVYTDRVEITNSGGWGARSTTETLFAKDITDVAVKGASKQLFITTHGKARAYNIFGQQSEHAFQAIRSIVE